MNVTPNLREDHLSQLPALMWLQKLGYTYLTPAEALAERGGRTSGVLLEGVLRRQLARLNQIQHKGSTYPFSEANLSLGVQALRELPWPQGYVAATSRAYDLLTLGSGLEQTVGSPPERKSFSLRYVDWANWENNVFHVTDEFAVTRTGRNDTYRPDVVLFVNGIPLAVIECKRPTEGALTQAISQHLRNQHESGIRPLFAWAQLLIGTDVDHVRYGTAGTKEEFWAQWREKFGQPEEETAWEGQLSRLKNRWLKPKQEAALFGTDYAYALPYFRTQAAAPQQLTAQDRALWSLCRPERLLELVFGYVLYENGEKKIARYQQFFGIRKTMRRVHEVQPDGRRPGGVVWHTQGSGKSLTMVLLAQQLASDAAILTPKIVLVTDRTDLDEQIEGTFKKCGQLPRRAKTGKHLLKLLADPKVAVITTLIHKFDNAVKHMTAPYDADDVFVLVDEGHRTQYGPMSVKMRQVLPRACFIAFTGTPLLKREKNTAAKFGGLLDTYSIVEAVADGAVVPLLYEGRHAVQRVNAAALDRYFSKVTEPLNEYQRADMKRKVSRADQVNEAQQKLYAVAWDVSEHFAKYWQGKEGGFKGQLVAPSKDAALKYKAFLDEIGKVTTEVLISGPDDRDGTTSAYEEPTDRVQRFWKRMMDEHGSPEVYQRNIVNRFKHQDQPEIIIVVHKLLTGFDAPRNTVLYLDKKLREHTLLQAIARVNRVYPGKEFGYVIDYFGNLEDLHEALTTYSGLAEFDEGDLRGALASVRSEVAKLPQKHSELWDLFKAVGNRYDAEAYQQVLADEAVRHDFYERYSAFARLLKLALSTMEFVEQTPPKQVTAYEHDTRFFYNLREQAKQRYADAVDYRQYEAQVQKLLDTHVSTEEVVPITELVNIFDQERFTAEVERVVGTAAKADTIAHRTARTISERMDEDPAFYRALSELVQETIDAFRQRRITEVEYLQRAQELRERVVNRQADANAVPAPLRHHPVAQAFYGLALNLLKEKLDGQAGPVAVEAGLALDAIVRSYVLDGDVPVVDWKGKADLIKRTKLALDDYLFEMKHEHAVTLTGDEIDRLVAQVMDVAQHRYA